MCDNSSHAEAAATELVGVGGAGDLQAGILLLTNPGFTLLVPCRWVHQALAGAGSIARLLQRETWELLLSAQPVLTVLGWTGSISERLAPKQMGGTSPRVAGWDHTHLPAWKSWC